MALKKTSPAKPSRPSGKKTAAKKIAVKKSPVKKTVTKKKVAAPVKKVASKKIAVKKAVVKKTDVKKAAPVKKKASLKKIVPAKKAVSKSSTIKNAAELLVDAAVDGILEIKGRNISILDLRGIHNRVCDYYIVCQADSSTQVNAIAGSVEVTVKKRIGERPFHTEGFQNSEWILVDYVTVVVHVFQTHIREFYKLEDLWADAEITKIAFD
jgi:ribosome-associated protein